MIGTGAPADIFARQFILTLRTVPFTPFPLVLTANFALQYKLEMSYVVHNVCISAYLSRYPYR